MSTYYKTHALVSSGAFLSPSFSSTAKGKKVSAEQEKKAQREAHEHQSRRA